MIIQADAIGISAKRKVISVGLRRKNLHAGLRNMYTCGEKEHARKWTKLAIVPLEQRIIGTNRVNPAVEIDKKVIKNRLLDFIRFRYALRYKMTIQR